MNGEDRGTGSPEMIRTGQGMERRMLSMYGENQAISGSYEESLAAHCVNGIFVGKERDGVLCFKGIPYAEAPVGKLRWKRPVPAARRDGVYQAFCFGHSPIQTKWPSEVGSYYPQSEDCLTLNLWTNRRQGIPLKPVMVFFHGGSYGWGATSDPMYDGYNLAKRFDDIVLVTVEYRIGIMGFIDFSSVEGGEEYPESGNLGLLDQICALKWIRDNIRPFGGDPENVTIMGESAGAGSVSLLPLIDEAKGLFRRIIAQSGSVALTYSRQECQKLTALLLEKTGCRSMSELIALPEKALRQANKDLNDYNNFPERDGVILPEDPYSAWQNVSHSEIDMLIGTNADETRYWIREMGYYVPGIPGKTIYRHGMEVMFDNNAKLFSEEEKKRAQIFLEKQKGSRIWRLTEFYNEVIFRLPAMKQAALHAQGGGAAYTYYWTKPGEDRLIGASHAIELSYVFRNREVTIYNGKEYDENLADIVQEMWVNFARKGNPSTDGYLWEPYDTDTRKTMVLGTEVHMTEDLMAKRRSLLEPLLHHYLNGCYTQLSLNIPYIWKMAAKLTGAAAAGTFLFLKLRGGKHIGSRV